MTGNESEPRFWKLANDSHINSTNVTGSGCTDDQGCDVLQRYAAWELQFYNYLFVYITPCIFALIIIIGTTGNVMVCYVIVSRPKMRTTTNILLLNLAIADIAFLITYVPFQLHKYAGSSWLLGEGICRLVQYSLYVTSYVTVYTLTAIAFVRYFAVVWANSTARYRTKRNVTYLCVSIWVVMCLCNVPTLGAHRVSTSQSYSYCGSNPRYTKQLLLSFVLCAYLLPLTIICIVYTLIISYLRQNQSSMLMNAAAASGSSTRNKSSSKTTKASKTIIIVIIVFCISWLPSHVNNVIALFFTVPLSVFYEVFRVLSYSMAYGNSLANPFIYHYASEEFRAAFKEIFTSRCVTDDGSHRSCSTRTGTTRTVECHDQPEPATVHELKPLQANETEHV